LKDLNKPKKKTANKLLPDQRQRNRYDQHRTAAHQVFGLIVGLVPKAKINANANAQQKHKDENDVVGQREALQVRDHIFDFRHFVPATRTLVSSADHREKEKKRKHPKRA
jgi:hypothetical protein